MQISRRWLLGLFLVGPVVGLLVHGVAAEYERGRALALFEEDVTQSAASLEETGRSVVEVLHSLRALFDASETVGEDEFATFTREALSLHPAIRALAWAPGVPDGDTAGTREPVRYPIAYVQPLRGNERALGFDLASEPVRRAALERALATNVPVVTDPVRLDGDRPDANALLGLLAVRGSGSARRPPTVGLVVVVFRMEDLIAASSLREGARVPAPMHFVVSDPETGAGEPVVLAASPAPPAPDDPFVTTRSIDIGSQTWRLEASPTRAFLDRHHSRQPLLLALLLALLFETVLGALLVASRRARDAAQRRHARRIQAVLRSLHDGVIVADAEGRVELANQAAASLLGPVAEGTPLAEWAARGGCRLPDALTPGPADGDGLQDAELHLRRDASSPGRWIRVRAAPLDRDPEGDEGGVYVVSDITVRKEREAQLRQLSNAVEQTADAVLITDRAGHILYVNPAFEAMTGYARDEVLGRTPRLLKSGRHDDAFYAHLWREVTEGRVYRATIVNRKKDGELFHAAQTITPMRDEQGDVTHFVSVLKDMTQERRREQQETELRLAAAVQKTMYPASPPHLEGLDIAGAVSSAEATCGDYYDFVDLHDGTLALVIGDITGHGFGPALIMAETRAYLRSMFLAQVGLAPTFGNLNRVLDAELPEDRFVSLLVARIDPRSRRLTWCNAGHPEGILITRDGRRKATLAPTGPILGVLPDATFTEDGPLVLEDGDVLVLVTDGLTEARSAAGDFFALEGVATAARAHRDQPARVILERVLAATDAFAVGGQADDDRTLIVCKATPRA